MEHPICTMMCEDCGKFAIMHENGLTIFLINKEFFAMSRCLFCNRTVKDSISKEVCISLFWENVRIFNFNTGEQILNEEILENI
jgi:hypothetical protein